MNTFAIETSYNNKPSYILYSKYYSNQEYSRRLPSVASGHLLMMACILLLMVTSCQATTSSKVVAPATDSTKMIDGTTLYYSDHGDSDKVVLCIHGLGSNSAAWNRVIDTLDSDARVIVVDLPRYLDVDSMESISLIKYADYCRQLLDKLDLGSVIVAGHSMGGQVAIHFAHRYPERVHHLLLCAPAGLEVFSEQDRAWFDAVITPAFYSSLSPEVIRSNFDINFYGNKMPSDAEFMYQDRMQLAKDTVLIDRYHQSIVASIQAMLNEPVDQLLPEILTPTTVLLGDSDLLIPNRYLHPSLDNTAMALAASVLPHHTVHILEQSGHFVIWDRADAVAKTIKSIQ